jgi:tRNA/tmRNA/rRNA uracil-C5-methylase (TrmA/RlmC/RlmD family)
MKKGQIYEGTVSRVDFPNKGRLEVEGEKAVVKNALPGQKISFAVTKNRNGKAEGSLLKVLEKSPLETRAGACRSFGACGGCSYQALPYECQLEIKKDQVKRLVDEVCKDYQFEGILGSPVEWGYRNKMEFSFGDEYKGGPLALGLHKKGSFHDIITADDCVIVDKDYNKILSCVLNYFSGLGFTYFHKLTHKGYLRHLLVRKAMKTGEILINVITTSQEEQILKPITGQTCMTDNSLTEGSLSNAAMDSKSADDITKELWTELVRPLLNLELSGSIAGILHTYNDSPADIVQSDRTELLYGRDYIYEELLGLRFKITTFSFFQTNSLGAEVLYSKVREYVGDTKEKSIFDLYSGTGTIAQLLAPVAGKVTGVEIVGEAVEAARVNAALNGLTNCEFIAGDVLKVVDELNDKPDIIVLDPPRDGIHPKALDKIINFGVDRIIYVSCKPTSLIRDLVVLQARGYQVEKVCAVDMFPQTVHVETVVLMTRVDK